MAMRRLAGIGLALVALLGIVALASRGPRPLGVGGGTAHVGPSFFDYVFTSVLIAFVGGLVLAVLVASRVRKGPVPPQRSWWKNIVLLGATVLVFTLLARAHLLPHRFQNPAGSGRQGTARGQVLPADAKGHGRDVQLKWLEVAIVGGLMLAGAGALLVRRRLDRPEADEPDPLDPGAAAEVSALLDDALDDLRSERDVRRAVIAAYARMEGALAAHGLPRRRSEAPLEYLERTLIRLRASAAAVRRLTDLFEWAKFSPHEVDAAMRDEAVDALVEVRDELRAAT